MELLQDKINQSEIEKYIFENIYELDETQFLDPNEISKKNSTSSNKNRWI